MPPCPSHNDLRQIYPTRAEATVEDGFEQLGLALLDLDDADFTEPIPASRILARSSPTPRHGSVVLTTLVRKQRRTAAGIGQEFGTIPMKIG